LPRNEENVFGVSGAVPPVVGVRVGAAGIVVELAAVIWLLIEVRSDCRLVTWLVAACCCVVSD